MGSRAGKWSAPSGWATARERAARSASSNWRPPTSQGSADETGERLADQGQGRRPMNMPDRRAPIFAAGFVLLLTGVMAALAAVPVVSATGGWTSPKAVDP